MFIEGKKEKKRKEGSGEGGTDEGRKEYGGGGEEDKLRYALFFSHLYRSYICAC